MATLDDVRRIALSLPRTSEHLIRDRTKFRVGSLVYASVSADEERLGFGFPKEERAALVASEPDKFLMPLRSDERYNWVRARLPALDPGELRELLIDAWCMVVPKRSRPATWKARASARADALARIGPAPRSRPHIVVAACGGRLIHPGGRRMYQAERPRLCPSEPAGRTGQLAQVAAGQFGGTAMKVLQRSQWLARLAGCTALTFGMAALAAATPAHARATGIIFQSRVVASWGDNYYGELGDGTTTDRSRYGDLNALGNDMVQVSAGYYSGLALRGDGTVWAWGDNAAGQLGDGTTTTRSTPVQVTGLTGVTQVAAGHGFSLALRSDGTVWAWGGNSIGQLGHGTTSDHELAPVQVTGLAGVTKISAGSYFSLALRSDGTVWAWGYNQHGQLGNGTTASSSVPVKVTGLSHATGIAAGFDAAVATQTNGITVLASVWTWGGNNSGQLGDGTLTDHSTPERVTGINNVYLAGVTAGLWTAAVLGTDGSVWSWGNDTAGQLGTAPASSPVTRPVNTIAAGSRITQLSAGWGHMLALRSDGTVLAWGSNAGGQLGIGSTAPVAGPVQVTGLTAVSQVSAGGRAFSLAVHTVPWLVSQSS